MNTLIFPDFLSFLSITLPIWFPTKIINLPELIFSVFFVLSTYVFPVVNDSGESEGGLGYDIGYINYGYPEVDDADFSEVYLAFSYEGLGFSYYIGDEFGDYYDVSYGFGDFSVSYGDYEDTGSNFLLGYGFSLGDYDASVGYSSFSAEAASGLEDEDGLFFTVGASF